MAKVIVVTSGKGGVGKTTTTANLGTGLAMLGKNVALIDADIGLRNLDTVMGLENRIVFDLVDVVEGKCRAKQALIKDRRFGDRLCLLPAAQLRDKDSVEPEQMVELCKELASDFDFIIIDCPAGIERGFKNAIAGADLAIIVTTPEVSAIRDADRIIGLLEAEGKKSSKLVINRIRPNLVKRGDMMEVDDIIEILGIDLIGIIPDDDNVVITTNKGEAAVGNSNSKAGLAYRNIVQRLLGADVPFLKLKTDSLFDKLRKVIGF